ncbi:MAG: hypothetical protein HQM08_19580 [Candidatus Riflebacteria bacterium]|nr:hypothetical protein [Candidatus Riflebacteria bacterium]
MRIRNDTRKPIPKNLSASNFYSDLNNCTGRNIPLNSKRIAALSWVLLFVFILFPVSAQNVGDDSPILDGLILPRDFQAYFAPKNTITLPFTSSSSNGIQLAEILPEGTVVEKGKVIAKFMFKWDDVKLRIQQRTEQAVSQKEEEELSQKKKIAQIDFCLGQGTIKAKQAELDLLKKNSLSKIKQRLLECDYKQLSFEEKAMKHKLQAAHENFEKSMKWHQSNVKVWNAYLDTFNKTKDRYEVKASESGTLFFPVVNRLKRKIQKGDRVDSGTHFVSVIRSQSYELVFYVPEALFLKIQPGVEVTILTEKHGEINAKIRETAFFPQPFGDVKMNFNLPNAWDKCFIVKADLPANFPILSNNNVKVRLKH